MSDSVIKVVSDWGCRYKKEVKRKEFPFRNRNGERFEWENEEYDNVEGLLEDETQVKHPDLAAKFPGINLDKEDNGPAI